MIAFSVAPPLLLVTARPGRAVLPWLWLGAGALTVLLWRDPAFDRSSLSFRRWADGRWRHRGLQWVGVSFVLGLALKWYAPSLWFYLPREQPWVWALVVLLYPVLSVVPQTLVYRVFFWHRYRALFCSDRTAELAAACAFALMHVVFWNVWAPLLSLAGGWLFVRTYRETNSAWASALEHSLYGWTMMTVGWGVFFYHGSIATIHAWIGC